MVAIDQDKVAVVIAYGSTQSITIRVGTHYQIGVGFDRFLDGQVQRGRLLGIRRLHGGKVTTDNVLLGDADDVRETDGSQRIGNNGDAGAVDRSVNNLEVLEPLDRFGRENQLLYLFNKSFIHVFPDNFHQLLVSLETNISVRFHAVYFGNDVPVMGCQYLRAIVPVGLVTIVLLRIVRRRNHDTSLTAQLTNSVRH